MLIALYLILNIAYHTSMKQRFIVFIFLICSITVTDVLAQPLNNYIPVNNDSLQLLKLKNSIRDKYLKDSTGVSGDFKKDLREFYKDRYDYLADMFKNKEFFYSKETNTYLNALVSQIIDNNPELKQLGSRVLFSRAFWPNAASVGEGTIFFNFGLFTKLQNESQVVFVLCHELAHLYQDHSNKAVFQYLNTVNSAEFQAQLKEIKKMKYEKNKELNKLEKGFTFKSRRHGRDHESEADSVGLSFFKNTGYDLQEVLTGMALLDEIDKDNYNTTTGLQQHFNFAEYPFNKNWLKKEEGFFGGLPDKSINNKERDSLKTHPDCKARVAKLKPMVEQLNNAGRKKFVVGQAEFERLNRDLKFEIIQFCFEADWVSRCLYQTLEMLENEPDNIYLVTMVGKCFNAFYSNQKNHTLNRIVQLPSPYFDKNYDILLQFIQNISLGTIAALNYHFLNKYKPAMNGHAGFDKELNIALKNFNNK